jgi:hypothetical protein
MKSAIDKVENIFTHNGIYTVTSTATGEHRTFKVHTQHKDAKFAPNERVVYLLSGPDNESDYVSFGLVKNGFILLWKKFRGDTLYAKYARMLENLQRFIDKESITVQSSTYCRKCNRQLTDPTSIELGIGPVCRGDA